MHKSLIPALLIASTLIAGCGSGTTAKLNTSKDEEAYRESLTVAFRKMTPEQQEAFNWAVSEFNVQGFSIKYKDPTPREVVRREADEFILAAGEEITKTGAELVRNSAEYAKIDKLRADTIADLDKVVTTKVHLSKDGFMDNNLVFETKNGSHFNISQIMWEATLFIDNETTSDRTCRLNAYYSIDGGLASGATKQYSSRVESDCRSWSSVDVMKAKNIRIEMKVLPEYVEDFGNHHVLPAPSEEKELKSQLDRLKKMIETAKHYKDIV